MFSSTTEYSLYSHVSISLTYPASYWLLPQGRLSLKEATWYATWRNKNQATTRHFFSAALCTLFQSWGRWNTPFCGAWPHQTHEWDYQVHSKALQTPPKSPLITNKTIASSKISFYIPSMNIYAVVWIFISTFWLRLATTRCELRKTILILCITSEPKEKQRPQKGANERTRRCWQPRREE